VEIEGNQQPILRGTVYKGIIRVKQRMQLGPDKEGQFRQIEIASIRCMKELVKSAEAGQICSLAVKYGAMMEEWVKKGGVISRGMVLIDSSEKSPTCTRRFIGEIWTIDGKDKELPLSYQPLSIIIQ
jgi:GTPase